MQSDILGRQLNVGDYVICECRVYKIDRFTSKMVCIIPAYTSRNVRSYLRYGRELTRVPEEDVLLWILKQPA